MSRGMKKHLILNKNNFPRLQGQTSIQCDCTVIDEWPIRLPSDLRSCSILALVTIPHKVSHLQLKLAI